MRRELTAQEKQARDKAWEIVLILRKLIPTTGIYTVNRIVAGNKIGWEIKYHLSILLMPFVLVYLIVTEPLKNIPAENLAELTF